MVRRHHPVLAVISNCYSEAKGRFPRVTHPCATRPEGLVRLACVRHAASVRSEPGSNSQVLSKYHTARVNPPTAQYLTSGADTCTCQTYGYVRTCIGIDLVTGFRGPKTLRTGRRRPHVPSSKLTMSKNHQTQSGGQPALPDFPTGGLGVRLCWRPAKQSANPPFPAGEGAYMDTANTRQTDFAFFIHTPSHRPADEWIGANSTDLRPVPLGAKRAHPGHVLEVLPHPSAPIAMIALSMAQPGHAASILNFGEKAPPQEKLPRRNSKRLPDVAFPPTCGGSFFGKVRQ